MAKSLDPMLHEFRMEAATTKRVLDRVPADKLGWKPHQKSMSLGQLALHIAKVPGGIAQMSLANEFDASNANFNAPSPASLGEVQTALDQSVKTVEDTLSGMPDQDVMAPWRMTRNGNEIFAMPRIAMLRSIMLNHWYHHRGQLSVYLRMLDVPVPSIYGPSADENPFG